MGGGSKRQRWRIVRHFPLLTLCPFNLALPFNEGERKHCQDAALWANKLHGSVWLEAGCWGLSSRLLQCAAPKPRGRCGAGWTGGLLLPLTCAFLPPFPHSFLYKSFGPFPSLFVVSLSIPLLLQALFLGFASLLAFSVLVHLSVKWQAWPLGTH